MKAVFAEEMHRRQVQRKATRGAAPGLKDGGRSTQGVDFSPLGLCFCAV